MAEQVASTNRWKGRRVVILGAARQGVALARFLLRRQAFVTLSDLRPLQELEASVQALADLSEVAPTRLKWVCGGHPLSLLDDADLLCLSGGVPLDQPIVMEALRRGIPLSNDSQIFLEETPAQTIGITGSAGKTTTTTLLGRMAQAAAREPGRSAQVWVGGNIGLPLISLVDQMKPGDLAVMELSSFQLEIMSKSPQVAAVLNLTPNHLDRHGNMQAYAAAKARILAFQSPEDIAILNRDDAGAWSLAGLARGTLLSFGLQRSPAHPGTYLRGDDLVFWDGALETVLLQRQDIRLRGAHNLANVLAACAIACSVGVPAEAMRAGLDGFMGVEHRLEYVRTWGGADWYNDSIATAPERAIAAIRAFDEPLVLLAGGRDKNLPWEEFARLVRQRVDHLILFGEAADKIAKACGDDYPAIRCQNLEQAVQAAARVVQPGDVVLLSPGGTSFDEFRDFEERGECFKRLVMQL